MSQALINYLSKVMETMPGGIVTYLKQIDKLHHEVHEGYCFTANYLELSVANDAYSRLHVATGAKAAHLIIQIVTEGKAYYKTYSGTTFTGGTAPDASKLTVFNRSGVNPKVSTTTVKYGITVVTAGTMRGNQLINGGTGGNATGSSAGSRIESVLAPNSAFMLEVQNKKGMVQDIEIVLDWYEE